MNGSNWSETIKIRAKAVHDNIVVLRIWCTENNMSEEVLENLVDPMYALLDSIYSEAYHLTAELDYHRKHKGYSRRIINRKNRPARVGR